VLRDFIELRGEVDWLRSAHLCDVHDECVSV
jgi:hypothetical protein